MHGRQGWDELVGCCTILILKSSVLIVRLVTRIYLGLCEQY